jgi:predicted Rossmann fold nucleotide-binding protein DprA/Smf involved in DNA uptake
VLDELGDVGDALGKVKADADEGSLFEAAAPARTPTLTDDERRVWQVLGPGEQSIEAIAEKSGLAAAQVAARLITLQLKGLARQLPGNQFVRAK